MSSYYNSFLFLINEILTNGYNHNVLEILSVLAILSGISVIISKNPVVSVLYLIALFAAVSSYLIIIGLNFIGLSYLIVYIGAVNQCINFAAWVKIPLYKVHLIIKIFVLSFLDSLCSYYWFFDTNIYFTTNKVSNISTLKPQKSLLSPHRRRRQGAL